MPAHLNQVAMSVTDLPRTHDWYCRVFGYLPAGGTNSFKGWIASRVQGIPDVASTCWWLVDQQDYFQLELFQFQQPAVKPLPADWRLCDIGYGMVGLVVSDFDATLARLDQSGTALLTEPMGERGQRRVCLRDPEGVLLELMEADPCLVDPCLVDPCLADSPGVVPEPLSTVPHEVPVRTCSITLSVADLARSREVFVDALGLQEVEGLHLHAAEHEALWGLPGAQRQSLVLRAGDVLVEIVQYLDPPGRPWPEAYRISDQGLLNIALGFRSKKEFDAVHRRCLQAGMRANWRPLNLGAWAVVYVNDAQGFSVELLFVRPWYDGRMGFKPRPAPTMRRR